MTESFTLIAPVKSFTAWKIEENQVSVKNSQIPPLNWFRYTLYVVDEVVPPLPVQLVWKNSPFGLSTRS